MVNSLYDEAFYTIWIKLIKFFLVMKAIFVILTKKVDSRRKQMEFSKIIIFKMNYSNVFKK